EQPSKRNLSRSRLPLLGESADEVDNGLIGFPVLRREARDDIAKIAFVELCILADLARKEAFAQGTEWHKTDPKFFQRRDHFGFRLPPPQRIFTLQRRDRLNCMRTANGLDSRLRKTKMPHLTLRNEVFDRPRHILDRNVRIDAVLIEQVDHIRTKTFQSTLHVFADMCWLAVQT